jgi:hypothetical protein
MTAAQARAVRRMAQLLKQFDAQGRRRDTLPDGAVRKLTQRAVSLSIVVVGWGLR